MFFLFVVLKLPIVALGWLIWYAIRQEPEPADEPRDDGGTKRPPHPREPRPRGPRRGPHGDPAPAPPARVRKRKRVTVRARATR